MIEIDTTPPKADVVELRPPPDEGLRVVIDNTKRKPCTGMAHQILVDEHTRTISCNLCGAALDPFDALLDLAKRHSRKEGWYAHRLREVRALESRIDDLKRIETNARSRAKRAGGEIPGRCEQDEQLGDQLRAWIDSGRIRVHFDKRWTAAQAREGAAELVRLAMQLEAGRK